MKKLLFVLSIILLITGCQTNQINNQPIITTSFVTYDLTRQITQEDNVTLLLTPGADSHSFEPTSQDMKNINNAQLLIYTNDYLEPWVPRLIDDSIQTLNASQNITFHQDHGQMDPHTWTSMKNVTTIVDTILAELVNLYPNQKEIYQQNASELIAELNKLDQDYHQVFENKTEPLLFVGHFSLSYLMSDYGMEYISLFESLSHESEPSIDQLKTIIDTINHQKLDYFFVEELSELKIIKTIEQETNAKPLELSAAHNITKEQLADNLTFVEIQKQNIENLKLGLNHE